MSTNPYTSPSSCDNETQDRHGKAGGAAKTIGAAIAVVGLAVLAYGAVAFWLLQFLPRNGGPNGRLPSLYVIFAGIAAVLVGMVVRGVRLPGNLRGGDDPSRKAIPTGIGMLLLVAIVIALIVAIARL